MGIIKHLLMFLLLESGAVLAFVGHDAAPASSAATALCASPPAVTASRSSSTPMESAHENK